MGKSNNTFWPTLESNLGPHAWQSWITSLSWLRDQWTIISGQNHLLLGTSHPILLPHIPVPFVTVVSCDFFNPTQDEIITSFQTADCPMLKWCKINYSYKSILIYPTFIVNSQVSTSRIRLTSHKRIYRITVLVIYYTSLFTNTMCTLFSFCVSTVFVLLHFSNFSLFISCRS